MTLTARYEHAAGISRLHDFFARSARRWPDVPALDIPPAQGRRQRTTLSYAELDRAAELVAHSLDLTADGWIVAILLPRTAGGLYAAQLAALRSGAAYVCIDPAFPDEQVHHILRDSSATVLITDSEGQRRATRGGYSGSLVRVDQPLGAGTRQGVGSGADSVARDSFAYVIYTSGTTGAPKGVLISHLGICNLISADVAEFGLGPGDRVAQGSSAAYDSSVEEIWMALASGATVVVLDDDTTRLGPDLVPWLRDERITVLCPPPTLLRATGCTDPQRELPDLRLLYVGGEALPEDITNRWARGRRMVNGYGPTECTVTCVRQDVIAGQPVAIGRPVHGMRAWVLDDELHPVRDGERGELCMGGAGVALGYLHRPELNETKFPEHPRFGRLYRTGDLVHAEPDGTLYYHGRIDSQVKLRGYRIELEAIEACLANCPGVREAACRVQGEGAAQVLAAHIVAVDPAGPPPRADVEARLKQSLPTYMVPTLLATIPELPRSTSGKLRRADLPSLTTSKTRHRTPTPPRNTVEKRIADALRQVLSPVGEIGIDDDFFDELGGSSLQAGMLITALRADAFTASITVRDIYQARTVRELARHALLELARRTAHAEAPPKAAATRTPQRIVAGATAVQTLWLVAELLVASVVAYLVFFDALPWLSSGIGLIPLLLLMPLLLTAGRAVVSPLLVLIAVSVKKVLIGQYLPARAPVWGNLYVRMWIVQQLVRVIPWTTIAGTEFQCMALRALGARIGKRVHIHRGVDLLQGGWDLLDIGDDVTISQDASLRLVQLTDGDVVIGPVTLACGSTVDVRAGLGPNTTLGRNSWLSALSALPPGSVVPDEQKWDGIPAQPAGQAPQPPQNETRKALSPRWHGVVLILGRSILQGFLGLPAAMLMVAVVAEFGLDYDTLLYNVAHPTMYWSLLAVMAMLLCLSLVVTVTLEAVAARALGRVTPAVISRWSPAYIRVWLKTELVSTAGNWLSGSLFWPTWLRAAGMRIGRGCEISTITDVLPELVRIGPTTFLADGIYLGGPRIQRGTVTLAPVELGTNTFLGNHAVVPTGQRLPHDVLLGVATVADQNIVRPGTSWFGHPPFLLPRRDLVEADPSLTHHPSAIRRINRVLWEALRFALPIVPLIVLVAWVDALNTASTLPWPVLLFLAAPAITLIAAGLRYLVVLALKWALLGQVRPGTHPLWSCWCSRWDFLYVAWRYLAGPMLSFLEGTLLLPLFLRRTGMTIGRHVVLGHGFAQVVDPDMLHVADGATVNAMFQAHTFEDRVLKIGPIRVGNHATLAEGTVPLYGADIGPHARVAPHSVIMKHEHLPPGHVYEGAPTRRAPADEASPASSFPRSGPESLHH